MNSNSVSNKSPAQLQITNPSSITDRSFNPPIPQPNSQSQSQSQSISQSQSQSQSQSLSQTQCCPKCGSKVFKKNGYTRHGKQNHRCLDCGRQFSLESQEEVVIKIQP